MTFFLFLVVVEGLVGFMREVVNKNLFEGSQVGRGELRISFLQFADDVAFVRKPTIKNVLVIKIILKCFVLFSGLKVNLHKSKLAEI